MPLPVLSRRQALLGSLSAAILTPSMTMRAYGAPESPFALGVASGDPASDGFVIWTRIAPSPLAPDGLGGMSAPAQVKWTVWHDEALTQPALSGVVLTHPDSAHSVHIEVTGLKADRFYWYRFEALGVQSPVGRARTLPVETHAATALKLVVASCSHYELGYFSAYRHMANENPDLVLFLGDYIYEYSYSDTSKIVRQHDAPGEISDLAGYRNRYALYHMDADLQALHACTSCLMTWDDHEVQNDYGAALSQYMKYDAGMVALRRAAYQAYYENMPLRRTSRLIGTHLQLYKGYRFGTLAEINMLDGRQYRSPAACAVGDSRKGHVVDETCTDRLDPRRTMLGFEQEAWLFKRFQKSQAKWNILGQDLLAASLLQSGKNKDGQAIIGHWTDGWDGYPATRDRLLLAMQAARLKNPVILSGDIHSFWANELKADSRDPQSATIATEFVGTSITANSPPYKTFADLLPQNPHVKYFNSRTHGYMAVEVTPQALNTRFMAISDRRDPNATISNEISFAVETAKAAIHPIAT
ncbi:MAG: alkaline phosphatase D family protein [Asticcacaulis sp.]